MEDMPEALINYGDEVLKATPENSSFNTYLGREALNCIMIHDREVWGVLFSDNDIYEELGSFMIENDYPLYLNQQEVPEQVVDMYVHVETHDLRREETIPEDWL